MPHAPLIASPSIPARALVRAVAVLVVTLALAGLPAPVAAGPSAPRGPAVDRYVSEYLARNGLPGAAYAVVQDGDLAHSGAAGTADASTRLPAGSVSKTMTAVAVLQLVDEGRVGLDSPVTDYLPEFSARGPGARTITVRQLLAHTSGLPNPVLVPPATSLATRLTQVPRLTLASPPGETYSYSNIGYQVLARMVEVVADQPFGEYLDERLFDPLGMDATTSEVTTRGGGDSAQGHVTAYGLALALPELDSLVAGSGGVVSTAEDMAAWLAMLQRGGTTADGQRVLSAGLLEESFRPQPGNPDGLGWERTKEADPPQIGKSGTLTRTWRSSPPPAPASSSCWTVTRRRTPTPSRSPRASSTSRRGRSRASAHPWPHSSTSRSLP